MALLKSLASKYLTASTVLNVGAGVYFGMDQYQAERQSGRGVASSFASAAIDGVLPTFMGLGGYLAYSAVTGLPSLYTDVAPAIDQYNRNMNQQKHAGAFTNMTFNDTEQVHTMRQAGMAIAKRSRYNQEQAMMGNEAKYMFK